MIYQHRLSAGEIEADFPELYRYAGFAREKLTDSQMAELAQTAAAQIAQNMNCRAVYSKFPLELLPEEVVSFAGKSIKSHNLTVNLKNCHSLYLFAATLGPNVDKLIQKQARINPAMSVMMQAAGAMYIERYCDLLQEQLLAQELKDNNSFRPRYSPGFGDVTLEVQKIFFELLECQKNLALTLNDSLIMSPEKSVTAFIGVYKNDN